LRVRSLGPAGRWCESNAQRPVYRTGARPVLASAAAPPRPIFSEKPRSPSYLTSRDDTTFCGADLVGLLSVAWGSPADHQGKGTNQSCVCCPVNRNDGQDAAEPAVGS